MRKSSVFIYVLGLVFIGALAVLNQSCEKEDTDCIYIDKRLCDPNYVPPDSTVTLTFAGVPEGYVKKSLLEEFTGFLCINCPTATAVADSLKSIYPDRLTVVAIHCSPFFAEPLTTDPNEDFYLDFRSEEGEMLYEYYSPDGLPDGVINRLGDGSSSTISYHNWADRLYVVMANTDPEVYLDIAEVTIDADTTELRASVFVKPLIVDEEETYAINLGLMENGIIEAQKAPDNSTIPDYEHNHVFRGNSDGVWGRVAYDAESLPGEGEALLMSFVLDLDPEWKIENSEIFVYVYRESNREIIQVEELYLGE